MSLSVASQIKVFQSQPERVGSPQDAQAMLSWRVAEIVKKQLESKPESCLGLPTGRTPVACYRQLADWSQQGKLDWSRARAFGLDEYCGVDEAFSFRRYLDDHLYRYTNLSHKSNPLFSDNYDAEIERAGGLDLTLLGIGQNGHIAFNEPGTPLQSWTHSVLLTESTRNANAEFFRTGRIPTRAVTMGIQTLLASRLIILIASGESKKDIVNKALNGPVSADVTASFLQLHKNLLVMTDFQL